MKKTIDLNDFRAEFEYFGRLDNFSPDGLEALFDYLEQQEEYTGAEFELDVIALCCEFSEMTHEELADNYLGSISEELTEEEQEEREQEALEYVEDRTSVIRVNDNTVIIGEF